MDEERQMLPRKRSFQRETRALPFAGAVKHAGAFTGIPPFAARLFLQSR